MYKTNILNLSLEELQQAVVDLGEERFRAQQVFKWIYQKGVLDFTRMSDLPADLRSKLQEKFFLAELELARALRSKDKTEKFLFSLNDNHHLEAVMIPAQHRFTGCISTQVGCRFRCSFCASGLLGFKRNLTCAEMVGEALYLKNHSLKKKLTHLVFMGTGEPLDNYNHVIKAIRIINHHRGLNIGARRITISTCGIIPGIKKLAKEGLQIELSVSLHAADDKVRSQLMPVNKIYPLKELLAACRKYFQDINRQITFEYILMRGVNSDLQSARKVVTMLQDLECKVNLIPANSIPECGIESPENPEIMLFKDYLLRHGVKATFRKPRGQDIDAACGQLRLRYDKI